MFGSYDGLLVLFSLLVAILASYTALDMAGRISSAQGRAARSWLAGGACAMGTGIWSMHFVGMLAFSLPIPLGYDPSITVLSLLIAIASSAFALWLVARETLPWHRLVGGALLMGAGIAAMHYTGMAAMHMTPTIRYAPFPLVLSILVAVGASGFALWIAFNLRRLSPRVMPLRIGAAVVMGVAIAGMHYLGMDAAQFPANSICGAARGGVDTGWLALVIIVVTLAVLAIALITSVLDLRLESRTAILATSLAEANQELTYLAQHDNLTKLPNRRLLEDRLERAIQRAKTERSRFALMFMDLDGFKSVNDAYGHRIGDQLLLEVAQRIGSMVRAQDTIARVGGDEFVLLAVVTEPADAATLAAKLLAAIQEPFVVAGRLLGISTSIGIAMYPTDGAQQDELLTNADAAMYHAKGIGRNAYCFFEASMNANVHEQLQLVQDLRSAIDRNELILQYQPKFTAPDGRVIGVEALVRWSHPVRGLIAPEQFIPLAEKTGLIVPIGEWVLEEACRQISEWRHAGHADWTMAVNLSALQLGHGSLLQTVRDTLARYDLAPGCLTLEVTESTAMRNAEASLSVLRQLRDIGVRISIDDFGTGYSSLLNLKQLPASELKIDRGFVRDLVRDTDDAAIVSAIVALGRTLNLNIVAEGVETAAQQELLTQLGCDSLQGFLLGRPMSADQLIATVTAKQ
ncbi:putative bifunctional diguanylate cyclase/phosphodiesterase [Paraburkholderia sp. BCC1886]|uniref:putative bifunctional diguanylate cyclase/phosphodiesterase n=1 Tax=Paraburkholderia sp. BCC1886 TaxID=2562670 RepID=UPI0011827B4C|nr:EAL domain-containing protein [Paraburkholderia sp. BCC1886]